MKVKTEKILIVILSFMLVVVLGDMEAQVFAADFDAGDINADSSLDDDAPAVYKIDSETVLRVTNSYQNTFLGYYAGKEHSSDFGNTFIGYEAGLGCDPDFATPENPSGCGSTVRNNTAIGYKAGKANTLSTGNTFVGAHANRNGNTFGYNTSVGFIAGEENEGYGNTFLGAEAGRFVKGTMIGAEEGLQNIAVGLNALASNINKNISGNFNIHIGTYTGTTSTDLSSTIALGNDILVTEHNQMVVGSNSFRRCYDKNGNGQFDGDTDCETFSYDACDPSDYSCYFVGIKNSYWGSGVTAKSPQDFSINATGGEGTDVAGADLIIAGGMSTGSANGGSIIFKTSPSGTSSNDQNALVERMVIDSAGFVLRSASGNDVLNILPDTSDLIISIIAGSKFGVGTFFTPSAKFHLLNYHDIFDTVKIEDEYNDLTPFVIDNTGNVGIGTSSPQSKLAVSDLPTSPPDSSGTKGIVCITNDGNMWVDDNGDSNICG